MSKDELDKLKNYIDKKRVAKQPDELISEELIVSGWDREEVLQVLAGNDVPTPSEHDIKNIPTKKQAFNKTVQNTSQTGIKEPPIQVENVQYNVKVGKVRSKIGLAATISAFISWILTFSLTVVLLTITNSLLHESGYTAQEVKEELVFAIAVFIPLIPLWIYSIKRLHKALKENPANIDDVYFKKSIRFHFMFSLIISIFWSITAIYNILARTILNNTDVGTKQILNSFVFLIPTLGLTYFFWHYQKMTKR